jgi:predicted small metal-binding protein
MRRALAGDADWLLALTGCDFSGFLASPDNVGLIEDKGAAFFGFHFPGVYEVHCHFSQRGKAVREVSKRFLHHMRDEYGATEIYAPIPNESRHVKVYVRWLGFRSMGPCPAGELFKLEM